MSESGRGASPRPAPAAGVSPLRGPEAGSAPGRPRLVNVGYGNLLVAGRIVAIVSPQSSPMRRLRREASERGKLIDATEGRRTRSILVTDSDHVVLSAINPETLASRLVHEESGGGEG